MQVTQSGPDKLVIRDFPIGAALGFVAAGGGCLAAAHNQRHQPVAFWILASMAGAFFLGATFWAKRTVFEFDFVNDRLTWRRRGVFSRRGGVVPLTQVRAARVDRSDKTDGGPIFQVVLDTDAGVIPLAEWYSGFEATKQRLCATINDALCRRAAAQAGLGA